MTFRSRLLALAVLLVGLGSAAAAQSPFTPVARVNGDVITGYELAQRQRFLTLLGAPGEVRQDALDRMIEERLQLQAAEREGVEVAQADLRAGMEEFAGRANLSLDEFVSALQKNGVARETFRDFVRAGLAWRDTIRARFGPRLAIDETTVEKEMTAVRPGAGVRVLLSEIVLPAATPAALDAARARAQELSRITTLPAFSQAARQYSSASSAGRGGRVDWVRIEDLPPEVAQQVLTLKPGQVTEPVRVPDAVAVFQLRALEEVGGESGATSVDYAEYLIPRGGDDLAQAQRVAARVDTCDDLYGVAKGQSPARLQRHEAQVSELPRDVAAELSRLDPGETSAALVRGNARVLLMLCARNASGDLGLARSAVAARLRGEQLTAHAASYLAELRADAFIERLD